MLIFATSVNAPQGPQAWSTEQHSPAPRSSLACHQPSSLLNKTHFLFGCINLHTSRHKGYDL